MKWSDSLFRSDFSEFVVSNKYFVECEISGVDVKVFALNGVVVSVCDGQQRIVSVGKIFVGSSDEIGERSE